MKTPPAVHVHDAALGLVALGILADSGGAMLLKSRRASSCEGARMRLQAVP